MGVQWVKINFKFNKTFLLCPLPFLLFGTIAGCRSIFRERTWLVLFPAMLTFIITLLLAPMCLYFGSSQWVPGMVLSAAALADHPDWLCRLRFHWIAFCLSVLYLGFLVFHVMMTPKPHWEFEKPRYQQVNIGQGIDVLQVIGDDRCWATVLPCTNRSLKGLALIDPGHIEHGFVRTSSWDIRITGE